MNSISELFRHPGGKSVLVDTGFSWAAFIFGPFWAIVKKQWLLFAILLSVLVLVNALAEYALRLKNIGLLVLTLLCIVLYGVACGIYGNRWHRYCLLRQGYVADAAGDAPPIPMRIHGRLVKQGNARAAFQTQACIHFNHRT